MGVSSSLAEAQLVALLQEAVRLGCLASSLSESQGAPVSVQVYGFFTSGRKAPQPAPVNQGIPASAPGSRSSEWSDC